VLQYFEDTYISMDIGYDKPDLRFYQEALRRSGLSADEVLMIGDSMTTDILGAQAAGIDAIFFDRRGEIENGKGQTGACKVIRSLDQLSAIL
jgi:FMN phosphatase YigB (HAD superfamily)